MCVCVCVCVDLGDIYILAAVHTLGYKIHGKLIFSAFINDFILLYNKWKNKTK